jgi:hypothetical protein
VIAIESIDGRQLAQHRRTLPDNRPAGKGRFVWNTYHSQANTSTPAPQHHHHRERREGPPFYAGFERRLTALREAAASSGVARSTVELKLADAAVRDRQLLA